MASARCDVLVVGAGPAGVAAAVAAAERGASVVLLEESRELGGSVTAGMHRYLCGLYAARPGAGDAEETLNGGIQRRVVRELRARAPEVTGVRPLGRTWVLEFAQEAWRATLAKLLEDAGVAVRLGGAAGSVELAGNRIGAVVMKAGERVEAGAVVDCTGVGVVVEMAGAAQEAEAKRMLAGLAVRVGGIEGSGEMLHLQVPYALRMAAERGELPREARFAVFQMAGAVGEGLCKLAVSPDAAVGPGELADRCVTVLRDTLQDMAGAKVLAVSPRVLARDGRRLLGEVVLSEKDVLGGRVWAGCTGEVVRAWWPVEYWSSEEGPIYRYPPEGLAYTIGAGAVRSARIANLLAAGSSLSATAMAAASARAGGTCLATGEMAGVLAARCCGMSST